MYGQRIKELRKAAGLNQADLAAKMNISRPNISFWENAEYPPLEAVVRVCAVFGITVEEFFAGKRTVLNDEFPEELQGVMRGVMELDEESRDELLEVFTAILSKYRKAAAPHAAPRPLPAARVPETSHRIISPEQPSHDGLSFFARNAGAIMIKKYFERLAWTEQ